MNKLYISYFVEEVNGQESCPSHGVRKYHYGEIQNGFAKTVDNFQELYNGGLLYAFADETLFGRKPVIRYRAKTGKIKTVSEKDFVTYSVTECFREVDYRVTIDELMKRLSAEEFVQWCKDHGLSVCPVAK